MYDLDLNVNETGEKGTKLGMGSFSFSSSDLDDYSLRNDMFEAS